jgi:hypothetical protein
MRAVALLLAFITLPLPSLASTYQALCGDTQCSISIDANGISSPSGFIPTGRIAQWFTGGQESYSAAGGTAGALGGATAGAIGGALLLGPIGLLGGLIGGGIAGSKAGKSADLFFNVVGYDQAGKKTTIAFRFVNPKPANQLKTELPMFTGLAMGQTRSIDELRAALSESHAQAGASLLPDQLSASTSPISTSNKEASEAKVSPEKKSKTLPDSLAVAPVNKVEVNDDNAWADYLKKRNLTTWAQKNPELAAQLRSRVFPQAPTP